MLYSNILRGWNFVQVLMEWKIWYLIAPCILCEWRMYNPKFVVVRFSKLVEILSPQNWWFLEYHLTHLYICLCILHKYPFLCPCVIELYQVWHHNQYNYCLLVFPELTVRLSLHTVGDKNSHGILWYILWILTLQLQSSCTLFSTVAARWRAAKAFMALDFVFLTLNLNRQGPVLFS